MNLEIGEDLKSDQPILGVDFGSNNSSVAYYHKGKVSAVCWKNNSLNKTFPTCVAIHKETNQVAVGFEALVYKNSSSHYFIKNLKSALYNKKIFKVPNPIKIEILISLILIQLKRQVQLILKQAVCLAILTVPAYFGETIRHILKNAAKLANLEVLRIINEPTAAAVYYSFSNQKSDQTCVFIDIGGLTVDMSICNIFKNIIDVVCTYGDPLGGHYLVDLSLYRLLINQIKEQNPRLYKHFETSKALKKLLLDVLFFMVLSLLIIISPFC